MIENENVVAIVENEIKDTLKRLGIDCLDGYLLHTPEYIYRKDILNAINSVPASLYRTPESSTL